ncbi:ubiquinone biosynthesis protein COQ4 homolog, mitochondrial [Rhagoletis pomonella]|uniref:ubiquinone biosynthesis protein COQ4 homolog, mitochondrial n=1 Tax=Rhagoletis pomonella TaxID=28610 RepID=UPI00177BD902|nr:ubiquinone biosynthesis protein COQ4 homolog, mitochondrial [Rhagoletis pomonella]XP_036336365.1 ubiquinone biosynthesis protein COQ4 homolog, mitochondrial [Rhagoletis pomonella]
MLQRVRTQLLLRSPQLHRYATTFAAESNATGTEKSESPPINETLLDEFTKEFLQNRIEMSPFQKLLLGVGSSIAALVDPRRHDMIAALGETTGEAALQNILQTMQATAEGKRLLEHKPRINTRTVDIERLRTLPENTLGRAYVRFLDDNQVTPDSRMAVRFVNDPMLAYVMTRYRECHDLAHTVLGMPTNMLGEVAVKWVEALNNGLPMCYGGAIFGAMRLRPKQRKEYVSRYLPWALNNGRQMKPLMPVYFEERWEQDIEELRKELRVTILK